MKLVSVEPRRLKPGLLLIGLALLIAFIPAPARANAPQEHTFRVEASRFAYTPAILSVNRGDRVTIELVATDVVHGLAIDIYGQEITADPGQTARLTFTADRPGTFRFRCTATCGPMHPFMIGKLRVGNDLWFWRAAGLSILAVVAAVWWRRK